MPPPSPEPVTEPRRWAILASSLLAAMATTCLASGVAFLIPRLHSDGMSLQAAAILASAPMVGMVATTVLWAWGWWLFNIEAAMFTCLFLGSLASSYARSQLILI